MATIRYDVKGLEVELSTPPLKALTALREAPSVNDHSVMREFVRSMVSDSVYQDLCRRRPACFKSLGFAALVDWGIDKVNCKVLSPDEIEDKEFADAFCEQQDRARNLYQDPDDDRGAVYPVVVTVRKEERRFIMRAPNGEREVERLRKANTAEAAKKYCEDHIVWPKGASDDWLEHAPGLYLLVSEMSLDLAGDTEIRRVGE